MYQEYPKWLYHKTLPPVIVNTPEEEAALGPGWADSPARFLEQAQETVQEPPTKPQTPASPGETVRNRRPRK